MTTNLLRVIDGSANNFNGVQKFSDIIQIILEILHYIGLSDNNINIHYKDSINDKFIATIKQTSKIDIMISYDKDLVEVTYAKGYNLNKEFIEAIKEKTKDLNIEILYQEKDF